MSNTAIWIDTGFLVALFPDGSCFPIEQSGSNKAIENGVKMAEFLLLWQTKDNPPVVWIVEAKSSTPRPQTQPDFEEFIEEIRHKLSNALSLGLAACLGRHPASGAGLSESFKNRDLG